MYTVMIADDDQLLRNRVSSLLPLSELELTVCAEAEDGIQALEYFEELHPQIIIMDIKMPFIDGIDASKTILQKDGNTNIIILTGYGTVDNAKDALKSGMVDFLLKPVDPEELRNALKNAIERIEDNKKKLLEQRRIERLLERSMPILRNRFFLSLMNSSGDTITEEECRQYFRDFNLPEYAEKFCVATLVLDSTDARINEQLAVQSLIEDNINDFMKSETSGALVFNDTMNRIIVLFLAKEKKTLQNIDRNLIAVRDKLKYLYRIDFRAGIGGIVEEIRKTGQSFKESELSLNYYRFLGTDNIVNISSLRDYHFTAPRLPSLRYSEIMNLLTNSSAESGYSVIRDHFQSLLFSPQASVNLIRNSAIEIISLLNACAAELGISEDEKEPGISSVYTRILNASQADSITEEVISIYDMLVENLNRKQAENSDHILSSIKYYTQQNYARKDLDLSTVAAHVNLSAGYVSRLFRAGEGCKYSDYLNRVRVDKAKELLRSTHMKIYEVSEAVGFQNPKYFFQVFKTITGERPKEFYTRNTE